MSLSTLRPCRARRPASAYVPHSSGSRSEVDAKYYARLNSFKAVSKLVKDVPLPDEDEDEEYEDDDAEHTDTDSDVAAEDDGEELARSEANEHKYDDEAVRVPPVYEEQLVRIESKKAEQRKIAAAAQMQIDDANSQLMELEKREAWTKEKQIKIKEAQEEQKRLAEEMAALKEQQRVAGEEKAREEANAKKAAEEARRNNYKETPAYKARLEVERVRTQEFIELTVHDRNRFLSNKNKNHRSRADNQARIVKLAKEYEDMEKLLGDMKDQLCDLSSQYVRQWCQSGTDSGQWRWVVEHIPCVWCRQMSSGLIEGVPYCAECHREKGRCIRCHVEVADNMADGEHCHECFLLICAGGGNNCNWYANQLSPNCKDADGTMWCEGCLALDGEDARSVAATSLARATAVATAAVVNDNPPSGSSSLAPVHIPAAPVPKRVASVMKSPASSSSGSSALWAVPTVYNSFMLANKRQKIRQ